MTDRFEIKVDAELAVRWFGELQARGTNLSGLMADIGELLLESTQDRFRTGISPKGVKWAKIKHRAGSPLLDTGRMRDDIHPRSGSDFVEIRASAKQAKWHQFGTDPYIIRPKGKKALAWPGGPGPRKVVHHPGIIARPFIGLSRTDRRQIDDLAKRWLTT